MICNVLKELREKRGLSRQQLADILNISKRTLESYEYGSREPNIDMINKLADFYGVTTDYLFEREPTLLPTNTMEILGIEKSVDDDEFIRLYNELPDYAKQIFVDVMAKLARATEQESPKKKYITRKAGDIMDELHSDEQANEKGATGS